MPRRCCMPACRGNYTSQERVSTFHFPRDENARREWIRAVHRDNFSPTEHSVVCELHFHAHDIERTTSAYDSKTGKLITASLDRPRIRKGAVPLLLPGCPGYLSRPSTSREHPEDRRQHLENAFVRSALKESLSSHEEHMKSISFSSLKELSDKINSCDLNEWTFVRKESNAYFLSISEVPFVKVLCYVKISANLSLTVHANDLQIGQIRNLKFPVIVSNTTQLTNVLNIVNLKFSNREDENPSENIDLALTVLNNLIEKFPDKHEMIKFMMEQVSLLKFKKNRVRYSWDNLVVWSLVHSISPHCYKFLRSSGIVIMPSPATLSRICGGFSSNPVLEQVPAHFLGYIAKKVSFLTEQDRTVLLLMDEIHLKSQMDYKGGNIVGQAYDRSECASAAYVFMVRSLDTQYTDVAHILPVKVMQAPALFICLKEIVLKLESIGFEVVGIVSDNNAINKKAVSYFSDPPELKIKYVHPSPGAACRPLYFLFDSVHLLKCVRNNWLNQKEQVIEFPDFSNEIDGGFACFKSLKSLHLLEKANLLKFANKLCLKSLYPSTIERQNVKLALHIFDHTTAIALKELGSKHNIEYWNDTAHFIEIICKWWDSVNVKTLLKGQRLLNRFQEPITRNSEHILEFLNQFSNWLMKENSQGIIGLSKQTHLALRHTTLALVDLAGYWLTEKKRQYFLTGKVQTDDLESRFGKYRQMSGGNYHVSIRQIFETESKLRVQSYVSLILKSQKFGDVIVSKDDILLNESEVNDLSKVTYFDELNVVVDDIDIQELDGDVWPVIHYISGYCSYKAIKKRKCDSCKIYLTGDDEDVKDDRNHLTAVTSRGGLCYPSQDVVTCVAYVYVTAQKLLTEKEELFLRERCQRNVLFCVSRSNLPDDIFVGFRCTANHLLCEIIDSILGAAVNILLNNYTKRVNDIVNTKNITTLKRKR